MADKNRCQAEGHVGGNALYLPNRDLDVAGFFMTKFQYPDFVSTMENTFALASFSRISSRVAALRSFGS